MCLHLSRMGQEAPTISSSSFTSTRSAISSQKPTSTPSLKPESTSSSTTASAQTTDGGAEASASADASSNSNKSSANAGAGPSSSGSKNADSSAGASANASANANGGPTYASASASASSNSDEDRYLAAHNPFRAQHGAGGLSWSDDLAGKAQQWANNCKFQHSGGSLGPFGENLAAGTGNQYNIESAIKLWTNESKDYDPSNPNPSHFTQVVWKGSTQLGCAVANCDGIFDASFGKAKFFVCEYSAQGNVIGQFTQNVQA
ncbi:hypothetical protein HGRIS_001356 [Hohenbuehelia grisea]|uniref:SCP domain-containing protein n=1 Tax=Hohenbuehelia grisea TaxID=104357 RepID=A0ABR3JP98_9AGAR